MEHRWAPLVERVVGSPAIGAPEAAQFSHFACKASKLCLRIAVFIYIVMNPPLARIDQIGVTATSQVEIPRPIPISVDIQMDVVNGHMVYIYIACGRIVFGSSL